MASTWPTSCGSELVNPFCIQGYPTDPYQWYLYDGSAKAGWQFAPYWASTKTYALEDGVTYNGRIYICTSGTCVGPSSPDVDSINWTPLNSLLPSDEQQLECTRTGGPLPNPESAACEKSPLNGPEAACVNPCIRLSNGALAVNKNTSQCRVFPNTTEGGNATTVQGPSGATQSCPTVCPTACVEMWETCPPGTAPLTTLIQTKFPVDVKSLTGPYKASYDYLGNGPDGPSGPISNLNRLFPHNYARYDNGVLPIGGKPYTECYSYNTSFCELPMAWQETVSGPPPVSPFGSASDPITVCYSNCPAGTFQNPSDPHVCLFAPLDGFVDINDPFANYTPDTLVQKVFCNPQYFNPSYWNPIDYPGKGGIQNGCVAKALPAKQGSTCPAGTSPVINENFNLEWCLPDCPNGYFSDLTYSTCIPTCQGAFATAAGIPTENGRSTTDYNVYLDYVDFYAQEFRCKEITYETNTQTYSVSVDCIQNFTSGRCPAEQKKPKESDLYNRIVSDRTTTEPHDVIVSANSINTQCYDKLYREWLATRGKSGMPRNDYEAWKTYLDQIRKYQAANPNGPSKISAFYGSQNYTACPIGMTLGNTDCGENTNLCYDNCIDGYEPVTYCNNGAQNCSGSPENIVYACRALCPGPNEGLGPWKAVDAWPVYSCEYQYPNGVAPKDPAAWVTCPDDGRYTILQSSPNGPLISSQAAQDRSPPLCIRDTYLRHFTCPNGYNGSTDTTTGTTKCTEACDVGDMIVTLPDGTVVCQNVNIQNSKYQVDLLAVSNSNDTKPEFQHRVLRRLNLARGLGLDPNIGLQNPQAEPESPWLNYLKIAGFVIVGIVLFIVIKGFVTPKSKKTNNS
jgi:hypothetical protein